MRNTQIPVALHQLVDQLVCSLLPQPAHQKSLIVNDVQKGMLVNTDKNIPANVLSHLPDTTIMHTQNNCIRVSAKFFVNIILIHVKTATIFMTGQLSTVCTRLNPWRKNQEDASLSAILK